ncbi:MAG: RluA family pseudouridine synthase [Candidatus Magasanikbacteria bacterium]|nr:RluA family pseudouridine synthase [Candidatus Magasanikbacteria bacterium]
MPTFKIEEQDSNTRLDKFLTARMPGSSRSQIQKMIKDGAVTVSGKKISVHRFLKKGDEVSLREVKQRSNLVFEPKKIASPAARNDERKIPLPQIIFENDDFLVIDKPTGLLTHARDEKLLDQEPTVVHWLIKKYPSIIKIGDKPELRPGIVHRLDKETSGIMIVAKTQTAFEHLKKQFSEHLIKKEYYGWAI